MNPWMLLAYFTTYTVGFTLASRVVRFPQATMDILRAAVSIVAASVLYVYIRFGTSVIQAFYTRFGLRGGWVFLYDILIHFVPLVVVGGFPRSLLGLLGGYAVFLAWFLVVRQTVGLQHLYSPAIPKKDYDRWAMLFLPAILGGSWMVYRKWTRR